MRILAVLFAVSSLYAESPPKLMLWAWERPGDLRTLPPSAGVAFLAATVTLSQDGVDVVPRFQPLRLAPRAYRMAVVRIDARNGVSSATHLRATVDAIVDTLRVTRASAVQIDFDAARSQLGFYRDLLREVRGRLGHNRFLSMTALVSWCGTESWLKNLPVDEVVPMTFEMGAGAPAVETLLRSGGHLENSACRESMGIRLNDLPARSPGTRRTYIFAYENWDADVVKSLLRQLR